MAKPEDAVTPNDAIKDPYVLEFLDLKDEYSESDLEAALIQRLEYFLLELGEGFTFVGRQRRLRIDQTWYRVDLLFFHRKLHCLVIVDLKLGSLTLPMWGRCTCIATMPRNIGPTRMRIRRWA